MADSDNKLAYFLRLLGTGEGGEIESARKNIAHLLGEDATRDFFNTLADHAARIERGEDPFGQDTKLRERLDQYVRAYEDVLRQNGQIKTENKILRRIVTLGASLAGLKKGAYFSAIEVPATFLGGIPGQLMAHAAGTMLGIYKKWSTVDLISNDINGPSAGVRVLFSLAGSLLVAAALAAILDRGFNQIMRAEPQQAAEQKLAACDPQKSICQSVMIPFYYKQGRGMPEKTIFYAEWRNTVSPLDVGGAYHQNLTKVCKTQAFAVVDSSKADKPPRLADWEFRNVSCELLQTAYVNEQPWFQNKWNIVPDPPKEEAVTPKRSNNEFELTVENPARPEDSKKDDTQKKPSEPKQS